MFHGEYSDCDLCPRGCGVDRVSGKVGACNATSDMVVSRIGLHEWEEPVISGSVGSGTVFFAGCSLQCIYCQNRHISRSMCGAKMSEDELAKEMLRLESYGALNVNFVTPTHFAPSIRSSISKAREQGFSLPVVWNTSGYETQGSIRDNAGFVDVYLTDLKYADTGLARAYSHVPDYPKRALEALKVMVDTVGAPIYDMFNGDERMTSGVVVRHMMLPGHLDDSMATLHAVHERFGSDVRVSIMNQYTPIIAKDADAGDPIASKWLEDFPDLADRVSLDDYERLLDYADSLGIEDYFWQEGGAAEESFIPDF